MRKVLELLEVKRTKTAPQNEPRVWWILGLYTSTTNQINRQNILKILYIPLIYQIKFINNLKIFFCSYGLTIDNFDSIRSSKKYNNDNKKMKRIIKKKS